MEVNTEQHTYLESHANALLQRKKYRKMRQCFDDSMEEANNLFLATHHLQEVAQRLQEQNECVKLSS